MATLDQASSTAIRGRFSYTIPIACGTISGECCECTPLVPGRYATAITLLNPGLLRDPSPKPVTIFLQVAPTTLVGATAGRWPDTVPFRGGEVIKLEAARATTIDCCTVARLLLGAVTPGTTSATYGVVYLRTDGLLEVSAAYTSVGDEGTSPSIDVEIIEARELLVREKAPNPERPPTGRKGAKSSSN